MGGSYSAVEPNLGDVFYPDNPNRRRRAQQLSDDVRYWGDRFNEQKKRLDELEPKIRQRIDTYLKKHNYTSLADLVKKVNDTLKGDALKEWDKLRTSLSESHFLDNFILTVSGIIAAGTGVVLGGLVMLSIVAGPVGWAIFAGVSAAMGLVVVVAALIESITGAQERDDLRRAITKLSFARFDVLQTLRKLEVYQNWIIQFSDFFSDDWVEISPDIFEKKFGQGFRNDFPKFGRDAIMNELRSHDQGGNAWTNEDPNMDNVGVSKAGISSMVRTSHMSTANAGSVGLAMHDVPVLEPVSMDTVMEGHVDVTVTQEGLPAKDMSFELQKMVSSTDCIVRETRTDTFFGLRAKVIDPSKPVTGFADVHFDITNLATSEVSLDCTFARQAPMA